MRACGPRIAVAFVLAVAVFTWAGADESRTQVTRILEYRDGFIVIEGGLVYRLGRSVRVVTFDNREAEQKPAPGMYARLSFGPDGTVTEIAISSTAPNAEPSVSPSSEYEPVIFIVRVPPSTHLTDQVYLATSETSWNPTGVRMDRIDARDFRAIVNVPLRGVFKYLYTRGSMTSFERDTRGLQRKARDLRLTVGEERTEYDTVEHWGDEAGNGLLAPPQTFPTPYNPAPFPNLPTTSPLPLYFEV